MCALVGVLIKCLYEMHGAKIKTNICLFHFFTDSYFQSSKCNTLVSLTYEYPFCVKSFNTPLSVPVAARSKAWVCGRSSAGIVGSNPAGGMEVYLL